MDELIKKFVLERISIYNFSNKYGIDQNELIEKLKKAGFLYAKPKTKASTIIDLKYASEEYLANDTIQAKEICAKYKIAHETFSKYMKDFVGIPIRNRVKANFNEFYFDSIDTEEKAYILGYYWADGCISYSPLDKTNPKNIYTIEMSLQGSDIEILDLIKKEFNTSRPILTGDVVTPKGNISTRCRLLVNSKHMWETLNSYGCTPRKSLTERFPKKTIFKTEDLIRHFIRGYFDGDGCVSYANKEHTVGTIQILGTESFLKSLLGYLPKETQNLTIRHNHNNENEVIRLINTSHNKACKILHYLYDNANVYLTRKYNRYVALCCSNTANEGSKNGESCDANTVLTN